MSWRSPSGSWLILEALIVSKQILLTVFLFVVALGSGVIVGWNIPRAAPPGGRDRSGLATELKLTPEQQKKMGEIWQDVVRRGGSRQQHWDARRQASKDRDDAIVALFTPEQKTAYDRIMQKYNQQMADMNRESEASFQKAVEQTKAILNPEQRKKYEEIMARGFGPGGGRGRPGSRPSSGPAAAATRPAQAL